MKKKYIAVLLCALLFCGLIGCASTEPTQNSTDGSASLLQEATNWFETRLLNMKSFLLKLSMIVPFS